MTFFKDIALDKRGDHYFLVVKMSELVTQEIKLTPDMLEHILSQYREFKI